MFRSVTSLLKSGKTPVGIKYQLSSYIPNMRLFSSSLSDSDTWLAPDQMDELNLKKYRETGILSVTSLSDDYSPGRKDSSVNNPTKTIHEDEPDLNEGETSLHVLNRSYRRQTQLTRFLKTRVSEALKNHLTNKNFEFSSFLAFLNEACDHSLFIQKSIHPQTNDFNEPQYILYFSPGHESIHSTLVKTMYTLLVNEFNLQAELKHMPLYGVNDDPFVLVDLGQVAIKFVSRSNRRVYGIELNGQDSRAEQYQFWNEISQFTPTQFNVITRAKSETDRELFRAEDLDAVDMNDFTLAT